MTLVILLEVTRKLRRVMTRSSGASDRLDLPARLERSRQNRDRSKVNGAVFRAGGSRTPCLRLSISWTINKSKDARRCPFVGHVALQRLQFTSRQSVRNLCPQSSFMSQIKSRGQGVVHDSQLHATGYSVWSCAASCRAD